MLHLAPASRRCGKPEDRFMTVLKCGNQTLDLSRPQIMGVLNVTPDSFSDGGHHNNLDAALKQAQAMLKDGAAIIDIGGESTRPGAAVVSVQEEMDRVLPVLEKLRAETDALISVDTSTAVLMTEAAAKGASILNDVRALSRDGALQAAAKSGLPVCLMHMQGQPGTMQVNPEYGDVVTEVYNYLSQRIQTCEGVGITRDQLILDPGFGFGKTLKHNQQLLNNLDRFEGLGLPVLAGLSRKTMIGQMLGNEAGEPRSVDGRLFGSLSVALIAALKGAKIIRVHDVKETADVLRVFEAVVAEQG